MNTFPQKQQTQRALRWGFGLMITELELGSGDASTDHFLAAAIEGRDRGLLIHRSSPFLLIVSPAEGSNLSTERLPLLLIEGLDRVGSRVDVEEGEINAEDPTLVPTDHHSTVHV